MDEKITPKRRFTRKKQLERDIAVISAEMYKRNREMAETNKMLSLLRTVDALAMESHTSIKMVSEHITQAISQATDFSFVGLLTRSSRAKNTVTLYGMSGASLLGTPLPQFFSHPLQYVLTDDWSEELEQSRFISLENLSDKQLAVALNCTAAEIERFRQKLPLQSIYVVKLRARRRLVGLLVVGFLNSISELNNADTTLLDHVKDSIGVALDNKLLYEENQLVLRQLKDTNSKLKALDEAKDDFISMASHQLRTPLTSVKGYISMVLEEDAGTINEAQKKMLGQAFFSSQRMVYLIADLLNVSRIRTGKFLIERKAVNLADIVQEEIGQLTETAKSRNIVLTYDKYEDFPLMMLDETKTRQIIMNFVDNAIYYTPTGGHIAVVLKNLERSIELRVVDDGMGVPKAEQHHLFTKFYRAGNARIARPDGTGLGLYMAKKVIVAQGGSIIFDSVEGKGSTFGFVFSKSLIAESVPTAPVAELAVQAPK